MPPEQGIGSRTAPPTGSMEPKETVILVAEDEPLARNVVHLMLSKEGYDVLTANDGEEGLEIVDKFKDPIHLLLTDINMPKMNGLQLAERVRTLRPQTKIMIMSAATAEEILREN